MYFSSGNLCSVSHVVECRDNRPGRRESPLPRRDTKPPLEPEPYDDRANFGVTRANSRSSWKRIVFDEPFFLQVVLGGLGRRAGGGGGGAHASANGGGGGGAHASANEAVGVPIERIGT